MKKIMVAVAVLVVATSVMAVGPIAQTAAPVDAGTIIGTAAVGIPVGDMVEAAGTSIGGRATYGCIENLIACVDGAYSVDSESTSSVSPDIVDRSSPPIQVPPSTNAQDAISPSGLENESHLERNENTIALTASVRGAVWQSTSNSNSSPPKIAWISSHV